MSAARLFIASLRTPLIRVVPLAFLLGACVSTQDGPLDQTFAEQISLTAQETSAGPLPQIQSDAEVAPAVARPDLPEPGDSKAWRLRLTRL